jgi:formate/nitrite transporter FocA (FNT family)
MSTLDNDDLERIATLIEARMHHEAPPISRRELFLKHLPRRCLILGVVLGCGVVLHIIIEDTAARSFLQSAELALAAMFEAAFTRIKESV